MRGQKMDEHTMKPKAYSSVVQGLLVGLRPSRSGLYNLQSHFYKKLANLSQPSIYNVFYFPFLFGGGGPQKLASSYERLGTPA